MAHAPRKRAHPHDPTTVLNVRRSRPRLSSTLLDNLIRLPKHRRRNGESQRLHGLEVDDQLELGGLLDGKVGWFSALEYLVHVLMTAPRVHSIQIHSSSAPPSLIA